MSLDTTNGTALKFHLAFTPTPYNQQAALNLGDLSQLLGLSDGSAASNLSGITSLLDTTGKPISPFKRAAPCPSTWASILQTPLSRNRSSTTRASWICKRRPSPRT